MNFRLSQSDIMKLRVFFTAVIFLLATGTFAQKVQLLVGSSANTDADGIYVYEFDMRTGQAAFKRKNNVNRPSYMAFSADRKFLYAITEGESISAYSYKSSVGELNPLNKQNSGGKGPIHISIDQGSSYIFASNYDGGSLTVLPIRRDGSLDTVTQSFLQEWGKHR